MFSFLKRKRKPAFEKFLDSWKAAFELLLTLSTDEEGNPRPFEPTDVATSAAAVVGAAYLSKRGMRTFALSGRINEAEVGPYMDEVTSLFQFVAGASIREIERKEGRTIDPRSEQAWGFVESLWQVQEEKMLTYMEALVKGLLKGPGCSAGLLDLTIEVTRDVFGEEIPDVLFSLSLLGLVSEVGTAPSR